MADLRGHPSYGPKFSQFHEVFQKIWQNRMLAPPEGWHPLLRGILYPPLCHVVFSSNQAPPKCGVWLVLNIKEPTYPSQTRVWC